MTIQEAIKSGKPFKREVDADWAWIITNGLSFSWAFPLPKSFGSVGLKVALTPDDLLADDWEVKP